MFSNTIYKAQTKQHAIALQAFEDTLRDNITTNLVESSVFKPHPRKKQTYQIRHTPPLEVMIEALQTGQNPFRLSGYYTKKPARNPIFRNVAPRTQIFFILETLLQKVGIITDTHNYNPHVYQELTDADKRTVHYLLNIYQKGIVELYQSTQKFEVPQQVADQFLTPDPYTTHLKEAINSIIANNLVHDSTMYPTVTPQQEEQLTRLGIYPTTVGEEPPLYQKFTTIATQEFGIEEGRVIDDNYEQLTHRVAHLCSTYNSLTQEFVFNPDEAHQLFTVLNHITLPHHDTIIHQRDTTFMILNLKLLVNRIYEAHHHDGIPYEDMLQLPPHLVLPLILHDDEDPYTELENTEFPSRTHYINWVIAYMLPILKKGEDLTDDTVKEYLVNYISSII